METKVIPCLVRQGENLKKYRLIPLDESNEVTIGRSIDATVCLMSTSISRCHAKLKLLDNGDWVISDNKSLNGVAVNGKRLVPHKELVLRDGDQVHIGLSPDPNQAPEFVYSFHKAAKIKRPIKRPADQTDSCNSDLGKKRRIVVRTATLNSSDLPESDNYVSSSQEISESGSPLRKPSNIEHSSQWSPYREYKQQLIEHENNSRQKMEQFQTKLAEMQRILQEKESAEAKMREELLQERSKAEEQEKMMGELREKEEQMKLEMQEKEKLFQDEKQEISKKIEEIQQTLEEKLKEKELLLMNQLSSQRDALVLEKQRVEEKLQEEMNRALEEKDKLLEKELVSQKDKLEKVIANKELEQKLLESQLKDTQSENVKQKAAALSAREDVLSNFTDLMEMELQCSICSELFIKATSLNCSHSYCQLCISQWMRKKKECPICRAPFTIYTRSIVLDSYIDRMVDLLSDDLKKRRKEMIASRTEEQKQFDAANNRSPGAGPSSAGRGRAGSRRGGRGRGGGNSGTAAVAAQTRSQAPAAIVVSSESEDSDEVDAGFTDDDDDSSLDGEPDAYFGGYGRCYICGNRGHWANGCPLR